MLISSPRTSFAELSPRSARSVLVALAMFTLFCLAVSQSELRNKHLENVRDGGGADIRLYEAEVTRMRQGESYYHVAGEELRARGFPTRSVFNWRLPLLFQLIAAPPSLWFARLTLGGLAVTVLALRFRILEREAGSRAALGGTLLTVGALLPAFLGVGYLLPDVWSATLIALCLCAFGVNRPALGVVAGVASLFAREQGGLCCVIGLALAARRRAWPEVVGWSAGLALYATYFAWHAWMVSGLTGEHELAHREGWIQFSGAPFVIAACQMNCLLLLLPQWVTCLYFPLALLGFASWRTKFAERSGLVAAWYLIAFAIVGQPFNQYWGVLIAPVLAWGFARAPAALRDLWHAARWSERIASPNLA